MRSAAGADCPRDRLERVEDFLALLDLLAGFFFCVVVAVFPALLVCALAGNAPRNSKPAETVRQSKRGKARTLPRSQ